MEEYKVVEANNGDLYLVDIDDERKVIAIINKKAIAHFKLKDKEREEDGLL